MFSLIHILYKTQYVYPNMCLFDCITTFVFMYQSSDKKSNCLKKSFVIRNTYDRRYHFYLTFWSFFVIIKQMFYSLTCFEKTPFKLKYFFSIHYSQQFLQLRELGNMFLAEFLKNDKLKQKLNEIFYLLLFYVIDLNF